MITAVHYPPFRTCIIQNFKNNSEHFLCFSEMMLTDTFYEFYDESGEFIERAECRWNKVNIIDNYPNGYHEIVTDQEPIDLSEPPLFKYEEPMKSVWVTIKEMNDPMSKRRWR